MQKMSKSYNMNIKKVRKWNDLHQNLKKLTMNISDLNYYLLNKFAINSLIKSYQQLKM